jgi:hypothetical protein
MCTGGRLLADFQAGTFLRPEVPDVVGDCLTATADGTWVVWAFKIARPVGDRYRPLVGGDAYPLDAVATCRLDQDLRGDHHRAPDPACSCGFHALSQPWFVEPVGVVRLEVVLSGRILAYEWPQDGVLLRGERQIVMRLDTSPRAPQCADRLSGEDALAGLGTARRGPDDPDGDLVLRGHDDPHGGGPVRLALPAAEHAAYCSQLRCLPAGATV